MSMTQMRLSRKFIHEKIQRINEEDPGKQPYRLYSANGYHRLCKIINDAGGLSDINEAGTTLKDINHYLDYEI